MSMIPDITPDQIDDWFRIGKKSAKIKTVQKRTTGGRPIDPDTLQPKLPQHQHVPHYKRKPDFHGGHDYAEHYQKEEDEKLISRSSFFANDDTMSMVSSHLEALELDSTIAGTEVLPSDLAPENATHIYGVYDFHHHRYDDRLPINKFKEQVVSTIESNQVTVIQGATGSGKTTQVAQYILDCYARQNQYCNIVVTQPRRIAAISIARRVCQERNWQLGTVCGYQVGLDREASDDTRILYCTTGILLNKLINEKNMHKYTHVILDEVHERDQETDFALLVVRKLLRTNSRHTKVVLMSATFDSEMFAQYFAMPVRDRLEQAPVVDVEGRPFNVNEYYAEDLISLGPAPPLEESDPRISHEARSLAIELIQQFDKLEEKEQGLDDATGFALIRGTVLVFLPGLAEITSLEEALVKLSAKHQLTLIPLHSTITQDEQSQVFCQPSQGFRKVILSTNIAESSITVPDIKYVIDFCLTKNLVCDFDTNYTSLQIHWASKANCTQRKGRAGRVSNGRVYRLVTRHFYENRLQDYSTPEMQRCPLDKLILQVKVLDLGEPKAILALALAPPNLDDIERNILMLKEVGALSTKGYSNRHDGELTFVGRVLADLPVDTKIGKLLMLGYVFGLLEECLIIGAAMSLKSVFSQPFKLRLEAYRHKLEWANGSQSDSIAILNAYRTWERKLERGEFKRIGGGGEVGWGKQYYLQIRRLKEIKELIKDIEKRLMKFNILRPQYAPRYVNKLTEDQEKLLLKVVLAGAFYPNYFVKGEIDEMESLKSLSGRDPLNTIMVKGLPANQGTLYKQVVEDMFRKCEANPKAYFEETRAYIEFPWRVNKRSKVHEGVYMALKMKQLRMPLFIDLYSPEEARALLQRLQDAQDRQTMSGHLRTNRLTGSGQVTEEVGSNRVATHVNPPDPAKDVISICITEVIECGHFWAQYGEEENCNALYHVQKELNKDRGYSLKPLSGVVRVGLFCVAPYMDETLEYYRARIQSIQNKFDESVRAYRECVEVFFVDYGNTCEMKREELRGLPSHLLKIPFQAFECRLIKIRPSPIKCPDGKWTQKATHAFRELVLNHKLIARPYSIVHGVLRVDLIQMSQHGQFYVSARLNELEFADEAEESILSKQSYEQRQAEYMKARNLTGHRPKEPTGTLLGEPRADWLQVSLGAGGDFGARQRGNRVNLTGPTNPYEMSFHNMTNVGRLRATKIEPDSVNSVTIDDEPHNPHQRMMVAGFVGLNPNGSSVVARDTTVMPSIPGLPALVMLLFAPVAEFSLNSFAESAEDGVKPVFEILNMASKRDSRGSPYLKVGKSQTTILIPKLLPSDSSEDAVVTLFNEESEVDPGTKSVSDLQIPTPELLSSKRKLEMEFEAVSNQTPKRKLDHFIQLQNFWENKSGGKLSNVPALKTPKEEFVNNEKFSSEMFDSPIDETREKFTEKVYSERKPSKQLALEYTQMIESVVKNNVRSQRKELSDKAEKSMYDFTEDDTAAERMSLNEFRRLECDSPMRNVTRCELKSTFTFDPKIFHVRNSKKVATGNIEKGSLNREDTTSKPVDTTDCSHVKKQIDVSENMPPPSSIPKCQSSNKGTKPSPKVTPKTNTGLKLRQKLFEDRFCSPSVLTPPSPEVGRKRKRAGKKRLLSLEPCNYSQLFTPLENSYDEGKSVVSIHAEPLDDTDSDIWDEKQNEISLSNMSEIRPEHTIPSDSKEISVTEKDSFFDLTLNAQASENEHSVVDIRDISVIENCKEDQEGSQSTLKCSELYTPEIVKVSGGKKRQILQRQQTTLNETLISEGDQTADHSSLKCEVAEEIKGVVQEFLEAEESRNDVSVNVEILTMNSERQPVEYNDTLNSPPPLRIDLSTLEDFIPQSGNAAVEVTESIEYQPSGDMLDLDKNKENENSTNPESLKALSVSSLGSFRSKMYSEVLQDKNSYLSVPLHIDVTHNVNSTDLYCTETFDWINDDESQQMKLKPGNMDPCFSPDLRCTESPILTTSSSIPSSGNLLCWSPSLSESDNDNVFFACCVETDYKSDPCDSDTLTKHPLITTKRRNLKRPRRLDFDSSDDSSDEYTPSPKLPRTPLTDKHFEFPDLNGESDNEMKSLTEIDGNDLLNSSYIPDMEYPESLNSSSSYYKSFMFWSPTSSDMTDNNQWSPASSEISVPQSDIPSTNSSLNSEIETYPVYTQSGPTHLLPFNKDASAHPSIPLDLRINFDKNSRHEVNKLMPSDSEVSENECLDYSKTEDVQLYSQQALYEPICISEPRVATLEQNNSTVWKETDLGHVSYSYKPSEESTQYAIDCYNNAVYGPPANQNWLGNGSEFNAAVLNQTPTYGGEHTLQMIQNNTESPSVEFSSASGLYHCVPAIEGLTIPLQNFSYTVDKDSSLPAVPGLTIPLQSSPPSLNYEQAPQNQNFVNLQNSDIDQGSKSTDGDEKQPSACYYGDSNIRTEHSQDGYRSSGNSSESSSSDGENDLIKMMDISVKNKLKKKAGSRYISPNDQTFQLDESLKGVRPYVISGWISSTYLMALAKKSDLVNDMFDNALGEKGEIKDWIVENCRLTTPAVLARDLVFRLFTLEELENLNLIQLARTKMFKAIRKCVEKQFPMKVSKSVWNKRCLALVKSSVATLFKHRVRQVQNFFMVHGAFV